MYRLLQLRANSCKLSDWWDGQDDQDSIDETNGKKRLTKMILKKPSSK
jgi:hypothetical protein